MKKTTLTHPPYRAIYRGFFTGALFGSLCCTLKTEQHGRAPEKQAPGSCRPLEDMLSQSASDRADLADLLHISDAQLSYVENADPGCGLMKFGSAFIPFQNDIPKHTELYRLMTTKAGEWE